jgi:hypothetical protein
MEAMAVLTANSRPRDNSQPHKSARIQDAILQENWQKRLWQITWDPVLKAEFNSPVVGDLLAKRVEKIPVELKAGNAGPRGPVAVEDD